eukprot:5699954-Prymnesium_polylepis.2
MIRTCLSRVAAWATSRASSDCVVDSVAAVPRWAGGCTNSVGHRQTHARTVYKSPARCARFVYGSSFDRSFARFFIHFQNRIFSLPSRRSMFHVPRVRSPGSLLLPLARVCPRTVRMLGNHVSPKVV